MSEPINLRRVVRAMNEFRDTFTAPGWSYVTCHVSFVGRRKLTVYDDGSVRIGRERIDRSDVLLVSNTLKALAEEITP
jgi:hypothetical protein